jgi:hypothetical protein
MRSYQINLTVGQEDNIVNNMKLANIGSKKEYLNTAFTVFEWIIKQVQEGGIVASINYDKKVIKELSYNISREIL